MDEQARRFPTTYRLERPALHAELLQVCDKVGEKVGFTFEILQRGNTKMSQNDLVERNRRVVEEFRANGGRVQGRDSLILLTIKGAKSGQARIYPLMAVLYGDSYLAVASKGGAPENPLWHNNLLAHPDVTVEDVNETFEATARLLTGKEREQAFVRAVAVFPPYEEYQKRTAREIPVFVLERRASSQH